MKILEDEQGKMKARSGARRKVAQLLTIPSWRFMKRAKIARRVVEWIEEAADVCDTFGTSSQMFGTELSTKRLYPYLAQVGTRLSDRTNEGFVAGVAIRALLRFNDPKITDVSLAPDGVGSIFFRVMRTTQDA